LQNCRIAGLQKVGLSITSSNVWRNL
jgi:hypothetical protein